jgi:cytochrome c2
MLLHWAHATSRRCTLTPFEVVNRTTGWRKTFPRPRQSYGAEAVRRDWACAAMVAPACLLFATCDLSRTASRDTPRVRYGDAARGQTLVASGAYGCTACHDVPGVRGPKGMVGPPLAGIAQRAFIAGQLPNNPDMLVRFLQDPPALVPETGMPAVRLSLDQARDVAAYLYTLDQRSDAR